VMRLLITIITHFGMIKKARTKSFANISERIEGQKITLIELLIVFSEPE
jgi:hypothetical protein